MKKILLLMGFCCTVSLVNAQAPQHPDHGFQDNQHKMLAVVRNTSVYSNDNKLLAEFDRDMKGINIKNGQSQDIGYMNRTGLTMEYKNASHATIGYAVLDKDTYITTVQDASNKVLGYIKPGGIVENSSHSVIGYGLSVEPVWAAAYFFLVKI